MAAGKDDDPRLSKPASRRASATRTGDSSHQSTGARHRHRRVPALRAMRCAAEQLAELLGREPESVSALKPTEDGWQADVEVVELERIPETTSVMASYRVTLDEEGELIGYERHRRYTRGQIDRPT
ncbi:gas vesicle protein [Kitasatospora sp. NPDC051984]|uniref:gas vesicle protein n=1 Tax=Kitasatospora sp. NPDC051984 TaxID=3364059 RepID=UPI0037C85E5E